ncbi:MAG: MaoC family dehydratase [Candidatus Bipolaricaulia bacterium]
MSYAIGQTAEITRAVTADDVAQFAAIVGDHNPLHLDEDVAREGPFGARIAHGSLTAALVSSVLGTELPGPGTIFLEQQARFSAPVYVGDTVTARVEVVDWDEEKRRMRLKTVCENGSGETVLTGEALVIAPAASTDEDE